MALGNRRLALSTFILLYIMAYVCSSCSRSFDRLVGRTQHYKSCAARKARIEQTYRSHDDLLAGCAGTGRTGHLRDISEVAQSVKIPRTDLADLQMQRELLRRTLNYPVSLHMSVIS